MMLHRRTSIRAALVAMSIVCGAAIAQDASRITSVSLYPGSATVERSARVVPGMTRLEISGLPANFDPQTVRVESDAGVRIGEVSTKDQSRTAASNARESAIEEKIQALKDRQAVLEVDARSAQMTADFISRLGAPGGEKPAPLPSARSLAETIEAVRRGGSDAFGRIQKVQVQKREIDKQIRALERDLARLKSGAEDVRMIAVGVSAERPAALMRQKADELKSREEMPLELQTTFATEFEVPGTVSLPSDGRKLTVSLAKLSLPAKMRLRVVPRLDAAAVVTAEAERPEGVWLAGDIQLYRDGNYVGATSGNPQASAVLVLPFGRDSLVRVKVDRAKDRNGSGGLIGRRNEREVSDLYTLTSFHKAPV